MSCHLGRWCCWRQSGAPYSQCKSCANNQTLNNNVNDIRCDIVRNLLQRLLLQACNTQKACNTQTACLHRCSTRPRGSGARLRASGPTPDNRGGRPQGNTSKQSHLDLQRNRCIARKPFTTVLPASPQLPIYTTPPGTSPRRTARPCATPCRTMMISCKTPGRRRCTKRPNLQHCRSG